MNYSNLPEKLRKDGHFCTWRFETRGDKKTKVPNDPKTGKNAKSNDISTFSDLGTALSVIDRYDGLGFGVFGEFSGIDIDHCVDEYWTISALAFDIIKIMDSYTELSPSGTGVHIYFRTKDFSCKTEGNKQACHHETRTVQKNSQQHFYKCKRIGGASGDP